MVLAFDKKPFFRGVYNHGLSTAYLEPVKTPFITVLPLNSSFVQENWLHIFKFYLFSFLIEFNKPFKGKRRAKGIWLVHAYLINLRNIAKIRMYLTFESTKTLVHAYVTCRLDNCNSLLLGSPDYIIQKLQRVQNCAARLVAGQPRAAHIRPVLKELHWLPVEQRITFKVLLLTFKALNNLAPPYLSQLIVPYNPTRNLRSAGKHLLEVPNVRLKSYGDRAFSVAAPKQWNDIPLDIKLSGSVDVFKSRLKTYLFRLAFIWLFVLVLLLVSYFLFWL